MAHNALRHLRSFVGRLWYALSPALDSRPDELIAAARVHAGLAGRLPVCLAASFALSPAEMESLSRAEWVNGVVSKHGPQELSRLRQEMASANLGGYWEPGVWSLPPGATHVYFVGSWRLMTPAMLREAARQHVLTLTVRCGRTWVDVPLAAIRRLAVLRRIGLRAATWLPVGRLRRQIARLRRSLAAGAPLSAAMISSMIAESARGHAGAFVPGRVALACGNLAPGGAERQVAYTARGLAHAEGIERVELICDVLAAGHPERYDFYLPLLQRAGVPVRVVERRAVNRAMVGEPAALARRAASLPEGFLLDVANLYQEFIRLRPEVVHAWLDWSNTRAGLAAALAGVPRIVLSCRNVDPTHFGFYQPVMDPVYRALCALPNVVVLNNSRAGAASYAEWLELLPDRIKVIYNGLDMAPIDSGGALALKAQLGIPPGAPVVGGAFRFYPEKRPLLWVEVAAQVLRLNPETRFVLFGQGILHSEITNSARNLGIGDRLIVPGVTTDILAAMRAFDVFLLTSDNEGVPNVVLEAQWAGTPVVATAAGGVAEAVDSGRTGWIVDPPEPDELARRVAGLLADPRLREKVRSAGPEWIRARFSIARMIAETHEAYGFVGKGVTRGLDPGINALATRIKPADFRSGCSPA